VAIRLVNRTSRSVTLTHTGELLLEQIRPSMRMIADAITQIKGPRRAGCASTHRRRPSTSSCM